MAHSTKFLTLWEPNHTSIEEGQNLEALHGLLGIKQNHY